MISRRAMLSTALSAPLLAAGVGGCSVRWETNRRDPLAGVPKNSDGVEQWDLRQPPSRADVGMAEGEEFVAYEDRDRPRPIVLLLPQGRTLRLENVYLVTFDRITVTQERLSATDGPVQMDFRPELQPIAQAQEELRRSLGVIGADTGAAERWRRAVDSRPRTGMGSDQRVEGGASVQLGYLTIGAGAVFDPVAESGNATLKYHVNFA